MEKTALVFLSLLLISSVLLILNLTLTGFSIENKNDFDYTWTKAICEGNTCRDFEIKCLNERVIDIKPISGFVIFNNDWQDLRNEEERRKIC